MRRDKFAVRSLTIFINTNSFNPVPYYYSNAATYTSNYPTGIDQELREWASKCLEQIFKPEFHYARAGVLLAGLVPSDSLTERMYDNWKWERFRKLMCAVDEINRKRGSNTIRLGARRAENKWQPRVRRRTGRYTTRLNEIIVVK